jgi:hypothetical protein
MPTSRALTMEKSFDPLAYDELGPIYIPKA